ncbi:MAG: carboxymuconolactone decarboxylase family protein [Thalassobaculum sp.]|uniref:carboxymuconolactone decarboxylase family protein n=1 Tax=Thalassobaculum sp. TaxID=2022740 RepID=UPI0032ED6BDC
MARVPYLSPEDLAEADRDLLKRPITLHRALVNSPGMARAFGGLGQHIRYGSTLDPRLRELAIIQVGYLTRSAYEYSHHCKLGMTQFGVTEADIRAISRETDGNEQGGDGGFPGLETAVLRAAREMVTDLAVSDATFATLERHLDRERLVDLIVTIGFYCGVVRVLASLQIDVEDDYAPYLERFPFPATA